MNTKKFSCVPRRAILRNGEWEIILTVTTDNSEHESNCRIHLDEVRSVWGRYRYDEPQKQHIRALSLHYMETCRNNLNLFSLQHHLSAHNASSVSARFHPNAQLSELTEEFEEN